MVNVKQLIASIGRIAWKAGVVQGPGVRHVVEPDGSHTVTVRVPANLAEWTKPQEMAGPFHFREHPDLTWDELKPPPKTPSKPKK